MESEQITGQDRVTNGEVEIFFGSRFGYLDLIQDFSEAIGRWVGFDEDSRYWIGLSIRESVTNAIQHGNKLDESKKVSVRFQIMPDRLVICVQDQGEGFDDSEIPDPLDPENLLKPSGRGIFYVRSFMDDVRYRALPGGGLEMRMEKRLDHQKEGDENEN
ncbi:ATP-binding protein [Acidobacteria bacterium AH-259-O06]|nr:ATP-binding protein [Acidobacteria bacterium AH-259-O06]